MKTTLCLIKTLFKKGIFVAAICLCIPASIHGSSMVERLKTQFYAYLAAKAKRGGLDMIRQQLRQQLDPVITNFQIIQEQQNEDLNAFFNALNALGQDSTGLISRLSSVFFNKDYFTSIPDYAQKRHIAACQRAVFEVDWDIEGSMRLTNTDLTAFLSKRKFAEFIRKNTQWPYAYTGLAKLAQQFQKKYPDASNPYYFPRSIPYLASNIYEGETLTTAFNNNTSKQLLDWVQKKINAIFELDITDVGMKYVLLNLVSASATDQKAQETLYRLAFFYDYSLRKERSELETTEELTNITQKPDKNLGVIELKKLVGRFDWVRGRATIFWHSKWQSQGTIKKALDLKYSVDLYNRLSEKFPPQPTLIPQQRGSPSSIRLTQTIPFIPTQEIPASPQAPTIVRQEVHPQQTDVSKEIAEIIKKMEQLDHNANLYLEKMFLPKIQELWKKSPQEIFLSKDWLTKQENYSNDLTEQVELHINTLKPLVKDITPQQRDSLKDLEQSLITTIEEITNQLQAIVDKYNRETE